jgi:hypothetical protein
MHSLFSRIGLTILGAASVLLVAAQPPTSKTDSSRTPIMPGGGFRSSSTPKPYKEVITDKAKTDEGLFKVHKVEDKYFLKSPTHYLEETCLLSIVFQKRLPECAMVSSDMPVTR